MPSDRYKLYLEKGHKVLFNGSWYCYTCGLVGRDLGVARCGHPVLVSHRRKYEGSYVGAPKRRRISFKQGDPVVGGHLHEQEFGDAATEQDNVGGPDGHSIGDSPSEGEGRAALVRRLEVQGLGGSDPPKRRGSGSRPGSLVLVMALAAELLVLVVTVRKTRTLAREGESLARAQILVCFR